MVNLPFGPRKHERSISVWELGGKMDDVHMHADKLTGEVSRVSGSKIREWPSSITDRVESHFLRV